MTVKDRLEQKEILMFQKKCPDSNKIRSNSLNWLQRHTHIFTYFNMCFKDPQSMLKHQALN